MRIHHSTETLAGLHPVSCMGMFDGVHRGHRQLLGRLTELSIERNRPSLLITFWPHPRKVLYPNPQGLFYLNTLDEKLSLLEELSIDHVLVIPFTYAFSQQTACEFIADFLVKQLEIDYLLVGFNHHFGKDRMGCVEDLALCMPDKPFGIEKQTAYSIGDTELSSSIIRNLLQAGQVEQAADYLGYPYFLLGKVVSGHQIGRSLGFPTANLDCSDEHKLIPAHGVYAVVLEYAGSRYQGMLNVGYRPTLEHPEHSQSIEVHLFDFEGDMYDKEVQVYFVARLRDEVKFASLEALQEQLHLDKSAALLALQKK
ncbi:MAG: riboflavin biosynthesis protein RibF [Bacteroidales bacterium]|nr:riboflavin biosynthesis protein RibF [Bacteroidales bacterium]